MYLPELQIHQNRSALFATRCRSPEEQVETKIRCRKDKLVDALNNENVHISKITVELEPGRKILNSDKLPVSRKVLKEFYPVFSNGFIDVGDIANIGVDAPTSASPSPPLPSLGICTKPTPTFFNQSKLFKELALDFLHMRRKNFCPRSIRQLPNQRTKKIK